MSNSGLVTQHSGSLITQILDLVVVHAEIVSDFVQHREANLFAEVIRIRKVLKQGLGEDRDFVGQERWIKVGSVGQGNALIESVERVVARVEPFGAQELRRRSFFDYEFNVT